MAKQLKDYFPMIRERGEVLAEIGKSEYLREMFSAWTKEQQEDFLQMCTGGRGLKLLYDGFFKEIMSPEYHPERLNDFLSEMLQRKVRVLQVLPTDSVRLADESSLLIMDIVVELEDGSIANVEMQKIGYLFPGQRCACYSADLLLRQYKRVRGEKNKKFSYRDIKNVYTIVLFETSPKDFHKYTGEYYHFFEQKSDTGLNMELLQKYLFIPLDIFRKSPQNEGVRNKRDAWLALFSSESPEEIIRLIQQYPEFQEIYKEAYGICRNIEGVMEMFSEELYELDRNTVQYMIDEMQDTIDAQKEQMKEQSSKLEEQESKIREQEIAMVQMQERMLNLINGTITMMRRENLSEEEMVELLITQYQFTEEQAKACIDVTE